MSGGHRGAQPPPASNRQRRAVRDAPRLDLEVDARPPHLRHLAQEPDLTEQILDNEVVLPLATLVQATPQRASAARALAAKAPYIERVDKLVQALAATQGMQSDHVDRTVELVDGWLARNRG